MNFEPEHFPAVEIKAETKRYFNRNKGQRT